MMKAFFPCHQGAWESSFSHCKYLKKIGPHIQTMSPLTDQYKEVGNHLLTSFIEISVANTYPPFAIFLRYNNHISQPS